MARDVGAEKRIAFLALSVYELRRDAGDDELQALHEQNMARKGAIEERGFVVGQTDQLRLQALVEVLLAHFGLTLEAETHFERSFSLELDALEESAEDLESQLRRQRIAVAPGTRPPGAPVPRGR